MPDLQHRLRAHDLGFFEIVAELWGLELAASDVRSALPMLLRAILEPELVSEVVEALPEEGREALDALILAGGKLPWSQFTHRFGKLRDVGPGKRDREKPYLSPVSPVEMLWYRGLLGRDFFQYEGKPQECAYIPDDLLDLLPAAAPTETPLPGRGATPGETAHIIQVTDRILDHACTLLAALRLGEPKRSPVVKTWTPPFEFVYELLAALKLITSSEQLVPEDAKPFLEMPRGEALTWLVEGWRASALFNELHLMPGVVCEGSWKNDPLTTREYLLERLMEIPENSWWHLDSFIQSVYEREPHFQRPAGDFDTWLVRDAATGESLQGMAHWQQVDGALIRYLISGPMHWLGLTDLAAAKPGSPISAFRLSGWAEPLLLGKPVPGLPEENQPIESFTDGSVTAGVHTPRLARYQVSRFCLWIDETPTGYHYQLTPSSLQQAAEQGLKISHLAALLRKYGEPPPPSLVKALKQWEIKGGQVRIHPCTVLRVNSPEILKALKKTPAGRFLGDFLGPTAVIIHPGAVEKVTAALARLGYLSEVEVGSDKPGDTDRVDL